MASAPLTDSGLKKKISDIESALLGAIESIALFTTDKGVKIPSSIPDGGGLVLKRLSSGK